METPTVAIITFDVVLALRRAEEIRRALALEQSWTPFDTEEAARSAAQGWAARLVGVVGLPPGWLLDAWRADDDLAFVALFNAAGRRLVVV